MTDQAAAPRGAAADPSTFPIRPGRTIRTLGGIALVLTAVTIVEVIAALSGDPAAPSAVLFAAFFTITVTVTILAVARGRGVAALFVIGAVVVLAAFVAPIISVDYLVLSGILPVIALGATAPVASRRQMAAMAAAGFVAAITGGIIGSLIHGAGSIRLSPTPTQWLLAVGAGLVAALTTMLRADERLRDQVDRTREAIARLAAANAALTLSEARARDVFETYPIPMWLYDLQSTRMLDVNDAALARYGWTREEFLALTVDALRPPEPDQSFDAAVEAARRGEPIRGRFRHRTRTGEVIEVETQGVNVRFGNIPARAVTVIDISERAFLAAERDLLLDLAADVVIAGEINGTIVHAGRVARDLLGLEPGMVSARSFIRLVHPEDRPQAVDAFRRLREGEPISELTVRHRATTGDYRWLSWRAASDDGRRLVYAAARDVTAVRDLEEQHRHGERMRAVGRLAGGVAHDFNNLVTAIAGHAAFAAASVPPGSPAAADIEAITSTAQRAQALTAQLLAFGRPAAGAPRRVTLREIIDHLEPMLRRLIRENITFRVRHLGGDVPIVVDPDQLERVIVNLVANARDAMPSGGTLEVVTRNHHEPSPEGLREHALLEVRDTGTGMSPDVRERIFEPFFTTKPVGKGSGLGLASAYGIVTLAGGRLEVDTTPGVGSSFRVIFPAAGDQTAETDAPPEPSGATVAGRTTSEGSRHAGGSASGRRGPAGAGTVDPLAQRVPSGATILLVEDEPSLRALAARVLERGGHHVVTAENGAAALAIAAVEPRIDLVFSDIVMPGISGRELVTDLARRRPGVRILLTSGYEEHSPPRSSAALPFLPKPYEPAILLRTVSDLLVQTGTPAGAGGAD